MGNRGKTRGQLFDELEKPRHQAAIRHGEPVRSPPSELDRPEGGEAFRKALERLITERTARLETAILRLQAEIADRERAEAALRESESRLIFAFEVSQTGAWDLDLSDHTAKRSLQHDRIFGYPSRLSLWTYEMFLGHVLPEYRELVDDRFRQALATQGDWNVECPVRRSDGQIRWIWIAGRQCFDESGSPRRMVGIVQDISERKRAEEKLRANEAKLLAAAEIQAHLLPQESPRLPGFDIAGRCYPAEVAAGDDFDFLWLCDGSLLVVLGDVSGHGLGPAIVAADFCARLRTLSENVCELPEIAARVNAGLSQETAGEIFVTAILGRLDPKTRSLICLNAGHPKAVVLNAAGGIKARLSTGGLPFGILPEARYVADDPVELASGDIIFFYTDGLVEVRSRGKPIFGFDRTIEVVRENRQRPAAEIIEALHRSACQYAEDDKPADDITIIIVKVLDAAPDAAPLQGRPDPLATDQTLSRDEAVGGELEHEPL